MNETSATKNKNEKKNKKVWSKIINKNKDSVMIVPPHKKDQEIDTITLSWEEFNENFILDEKDTTHCYTKDGSKYEEVFLKMVKTDKKTPKSKENFKNSPKKVNKDADKKVEEKTTKTTEIKKTVENVGKKKNKITKRVVAFEYTMSIGDMIKLSSSNK